MVPAMIFRGIWISCFQLAAAWVLAVMLALSPAQAHQAQLAQGGPDKIKLTPCIKTVNLADRPESLLDSAAGFDCDVVQTDLGPGDYWVRIEVPPASTGNLHHLRWTSVWQNQATLFVDYADGDRDTIDVPSAGSGRFLHIGGDYTIGLRSDSPPRTILFRISGAGNLRGILLGPELLTTDAVASIDSRRSALYGGFLGLCLALLAYNLMMWRAMRETYLLAYCAMLVAALGYAFTTSAAISQIFPMLDNNDRLRLNYVMLASTAITALWFVRRFFDDWPFSQRFDRLIHGCLAAIAGAALLFALLAPWQMALLHQLHFLSFVGAFIIATGIAFRGWRIGGKVERLFVIAWSLPFLLNGLRLLNGFGIVPQSFWLDNSTLIALSAEALLSSMIITHRIRFIRADRDAARADEAEARHLADTDELTGLANRRALMRAACPPQGAAGHYRLILIDIDHFKAINDSVGHSAGDAVLQKVAGVIRSALRPDVVAARIGGEEFALLFPTGNVDRRYYGALLSRIRALPPVGGKRITVSMGAANGWLGGTEGEWLALYRAADAALYQAKENGRNRLIVAPRYRDVPAAA